MRGRIFVIDGKIPTPDQDSGSASTFAYLKILADAGFEVTFAPYNLWKGGRYGAALNLLGIDTPTWPRWWSIGRIVEKMAPRSDVVLLYRSLVADRLFKRVRKAAPAAKILFHPVDLSFLRMQRQAAISGDWFLADHARKTRVTELEWVARADTTIVVSAQELELLRVLQPDAVVHHIPFLREAPSNGRSRDRPEPDFQSRRDFLFLGNFDHTPNVDAMLWFVREVWPLIKAKGFDRFIIAGARVPREIARLASDQIEVRGYVEDLERLFATCRLSIAPLRYGAGVKGKIVSSLSFGVPVVASSMAAEGMGLRHQEDVLISDSQEAMAEQIVGLYNDAGLWRRLSSGGYPAFQDRFSLASGGPKVISIVDGLVAARRRHQPNSAR
jgi:glycosyltransferase involved in cell wall biosynthesis